MRLCLRPAYVSIRAECMSVAHLSVDSAQLTQVAPAGCVLFSTATSKKNEFSRNSEAFPIRGRFIENDRSRRKNSPSRRINLNPKP